VSRSPDPLVVQFLNVGQGDAAVVFLPNSTRALVIDAFDGNAVVDALNARGVDEIAVFFTHSDEDHVLGARDLLTNFTGRIIGLFYNFDRSQSHAGSDYHRYLRTIVSVTRNSLHQPWLDPFTTSLEQHGDFGNLVSYPVRLRILHPTHAHCSGLVGQSLNDQSGVLRVEYRPKKKPQRAVLFTGDVQLTGISLMFEQHQADLSVFQADVLKFPHHGAWPTSYDGITTFGGLRRRSMADFLSAIDPKLVVISAGFGNQHSHVRREVFTALQALGTDLRIACTDFTRTCTAGRPDPAQPHCAGDVTVTFRPNPPMDVLPAPAAHVTRIHLHTLPGVAGCYPLIPPPAPLSPPAPPRPPSSTPLGTSLKGKKSPNKHSPS
jgi:competence protein ComEC